MGDAAISYPPAAVAAPRLRVVPQEVSLLVLGKGTVGRELLGQVRAGAARLEGEHGVRLRVVGLADSRRAVCQPGGLDLGRWPEVLGGAAPAAAAELLDRLRRLPAPILVDCTAAEGMERLYERALEAGLHVVTANKKPLTIRTAGREALMEAAIRGRRALCYETTVGASLPVIGTLQDLVRTGDRVRRIEGSLSGTLGFVVGELMRGVRLSDATRRARELGYTEPNPRDDLAGTDVARKALILARELGIRLELEDVQVEPLVPVRLLAARSAAEFLEGLREHDEAASALVEGARREGKIVRYLASIAVAEDGGASARVGPVAVAADHPAARLRGTEAQVAYTTERYAEVPVVVQGAGAGGAVTAAGILAEIIRISRGLRGG